jgi:hypothetical protein
MTENANYKIKNAILTTLNNILIVGGIFCDLEKAFNCINDERLILKPETYEITGIDKELYQL